MKSKVTCPATMPRILILATFFGATIVGCLADGCATPTEEEIRNTVFYTLYDGPGSPGVAVTYGYVSTRRTVYIIHSWQQSSRQGWIVIMKDRYLSTDTSLDVILVDWSQFTRCDTFKTTVLAVQGVGEIVGEFIAMSDNLDDIEITAYGFGAHVAGVAGHRVQLIKNGRKVSRINGLDASDLYFRTRPNENRLDSSDAEVVQAFHTSEDGISYRYGTVDVYFNRGISTCGITQPGCPENPGLIGSAPPGLQNVFCNSIRAAVYFSDSIVNPVFAGVRCTCVDFVSNLCPQVYYVVGAQMLPNLPDGEYYVTTKNAAPW